MKVVMKDDQHVQLKSEQVFYGSSAHVWSSAFLWRATNLDYSAIIYLERFEYLCVVVEWTLANGLLATYQIHRKIWSSIAIQDVLWFDAFLFNSYKLRTMPGMKPRKKVSYMGKHTSYKIEHTNSLQYSLECLYWTSIQLGLWLSHCIAITGTWYIVCT